MKLLIYVSSVVYTDVAEGTQAGSTELCSMKNFPDCQESSGHQVLQFSSALLLQSVVIAFNFFLILLSLWMWWYHVVTRLGRWRGQRRILCMSAVAVKTSQQLEEKRAVHEGMSLELTSCYDFAWACKCDLCQDVLRSLQCSVKSSATNDVLHFPEATEYLCLKSLKTSIFQLAKHFVTENLL